MFTYMLDLAMKVDYFDPAFDKWERVLAWKPPKLDCPKGTDPKVQFSIPNRTLVRSSSSFRHGILRKHKCRERYRPVITAH